MRAHLVFVAFICALHAHAVTPRVVVEEPVYTYTNPDNGSGPLWSFGCSPVARVGDRVFVAEMQTGEGVPRLCNTRWRLLERVSGEWQPIAEATAFKQREPTLLTTDAKSSLFLYVNDSLMPPGTEYGACEPHLLWFNLSAPKPSPTKIAPEWQGKPTFTDHSYRGYAADPAQQHIIMVNIDAKTSEQHYAMMTMDGSPISRGALTFPIRSCYPQVAIENSRAHIVAVGDIVEPVEEWRKYKFEKTGSKWDYVFRRLYYARCNDAAKGSFNAPIEIANVEATAGHIANQDLWIAPNGDAYILYIEREVGAEVMREKFFPDKSTLGNLILAVVSNSGAIERTVLIEGKPDQQPGNARFHVTPNGNALVLLYLSGAQSQNVLMPVYPAVEPETRIPVPFKAPFGAFLNASVRAGNAPSNVIDIIGSNGTANTIAYGQIAIE